MLGLTHAERNGPEDTKRVIEQLRKNGTVDNLFSQVLLSGVLLSQAANTIQKLAACNWSSCLCCLCCVVVAAGPFGPVPKRECRAYPCTVL
jgi:hypothetical protein